MGDYIAFILPASYYWNYRRLYKFEIVYSCIIETPYTNETLKTSFTIYRRNDTKKDWRPEKVTRLKDITIKKYGRQNIKEGDTKKPVHASVDPYDICVNLWGKPLLKTKPYKHVQVATIKIHNESLRYDILEALQWAYEENMRTGFLSIKSISATQISIEDIENLLRVLVPQIK